MSGDARVSIERLRRRLPFFAFVLLLVFLVALLGFVCLCMTDHPAQAVDRALAAVAHAPAVIELWSFIVTVPLMLAAASLFGVTAARASPARLQRFLF